MTELTTQEFAVAIEHLREDLQNHRVETREDIRSLEKKTDEWQTEVRNEFNDVKGRLTVIETQTKDKSDAKRSTWDRVLAIIAIVVAGITAAIMYFVKGAS